MFSTMTGRVAPASLPAVVLQRVHQGIEILRRALDDVDRRSDLPIDEPCFDMRLSPSRSVALRSARRSFAEAFGGVLEIRNLHGQVGEEICQWHLGIGDRPFRVRVVLTDRAAIEHGGNDWIDPLWYVELVESHPALPPGAHSFWIRGPGWTVGRQAASVDHAAGPRPGVVIPFRPRRHSS